MTRLAEWTERAYAMLAEAQADDGEPQVFVLGSAAWEGLIRAAAEDYQAEVERIRELNRKLPELRLPEPDPYFDLPPNPSPNLPAAHLWGVPVFVRGDGDEIRLERWSASRVDPVLKALLSKPGTGPCDSE